jgi:hypothetical protein
LLPHFRPSTAPLPCEKKILRWPDPFGFGFLSPQPPGAVGIGSVRRGALTPHTRGQRELVLLCFGALHQHRRHSGARQRVRANRDPMTGSVKSPEFRSNNLWIPGPTLGVPSDVQLHIGEMTAGKISEATSWLRLASGRACRGFRPAHRRRRHRRPRGKYFPAVRSSFRNCRSSRRPSGDYAPRYGR